MGERVGQRFPTDEECNVLLNDFKYGTPCLFYADQEVFEKIVDPIVSYEDDPDPSMVMSTYMSFAEWSLFDSDQGDGMTTFKRAARNDPTLEEVAETQFFSQFWVLDQDSETGISHLRDTVTREDFEVHDWKIASNERWAEGLLGTRIARANGEWRRVGQCNFHDNAPSPIEEHRDHGGVGIQNVYTFILLTEALFGRRGTLRDYLFEVGGTKTREAAKQEENGHKRPRI